MVRYGHEVFKSRKLLPRHFICPLYNEIVVVRVLVYVQWTSESEYASVFVVNTVSLSYGVNRDC